MPDVDWEKVAEALEWNTPPPLDRLGGDSLDLILAAARWGLESQQRGEHGRQCCDPPCRTEEELEMSRDYIDTLEAPDA